MTAEVGIGGIRVGAGRPFTLIAGSCVIEDRDSALRHASYLEELTRRLDIPFIYKSSYDKANRTSLESFRGPGLDKGLAHTGGRETGARGSRAHGRARTRPDHPCL